MWETILTIFNRRQALRTAGLLALCVALITTLFFGVSTQAAPGINRTISFQGRLQYSTGGAVADGFYNMQFKIYQDGTATSGGTLEWTEDYINNNNDEGVQVKNGYFSVALGTNNPFANQVDWDQDTLWLTMNVAGSADNCTAFNGGACIADGEMNPRQRFTSTPYSLNSGALNGKTAENFVQLGQGVQEDASFNTSIHINKTGNAHFLHLQDTGEDILIIEQDGDIQFGSATDHGIFIGQSSADTAGRSLNVQAGTGGSGEGANGGTLILQGGTAGGTNGHGGWVSINAGTATGTGNNGTILIGEYTTNAVQIGSLSGTGTQMISIGANNTAGSTTNVTVGSGGSAAGGSTAIQSKDDTTFSTDGTQRARFSGDSNTLYLGNADSSGLATTANGFTVQGTSSNGVNAQGGTLTLQAGSATNGNANGGNLVLSGGHGVGAGEDGLVVITKPAFQTSSVQDCAVDCNIAQANVDANGIVMVNASAGGLTITLNDPVIVTPGRIVYVTAANGSEDFTLQTNGGGTGNLTSMRQNTSATMIWNGTDWTVAGASNSTTLQAAYDNTLQSAGGAELVVRKTNSTNGLTIRDSSDSPVNGTLFNIESSSAAGLFAVNSNLTEYATNAGSEVAGASASTFPTNTWSSIGSPSAFSRYTTAGNYINTGIASVAVTTSAAANDGVKNRLDDTLYAGMKYNVSFTTRLQAGQTFGDMNVYYSADGTAASVQCITGQQVKESIWTKVNCTFTAPSSSITSDNAILIRQSSATARTFYVDNLSVALAANFSYTTDGSVQNGGTFSTNWTTTGAGSTVTRHTNDGFDTSDSAQVVTTSGANAGVSNLLSVKPLPNTLYRVSVYAKVSAGSFNDFKIRYSRDGGTNMTECVDYNTRSISTSSWTQITCYFTTDGTAASTPRVYFVQESSSARTFWVDNASVTLTSNSTPNVQIGGGNDGGPTTLFTLDKSATAPVAIDNDALLGSMYYDTTLGKLQCYEADGWGACGSAPDNIVTISPEYTNAVMHGDGVGTMTSGLCSDALDINDATHGTAVCSTNETRNFYNWTSPQASAQSYSIFVTYQLPETLKSFISGSASLQAKTDSNNASVAYQVYKSNSSGLTPCGSSVSVATGNVSWQNGVATGTADPSACGFAAGDSIVFKITVTASSNANAYIGNLGFAFSNY